MLFSSDRGIRVREQMGDPETYARVGLLEVAIYDRGYGLSRALSGRDLGVQKTVCPTCPTMQTS